MKVAVLGAGALGACVGAALHRAGTDVHPFARSPCRCRTMRSVKVTSPHDNPVTHGNLCIKGRFGYQHVQNRG